MAPKFDKEEAFKKRIEEVTSQAKADASSKKPMDSYYVDRATATLGSVGPLLGQKYVETYVAERPKYNGGKKRKTREQKRKSRKTLRR